MAGRNNRIFMCDLTDCPALFNSVSILNLFLFVNLVWTYLWYNEESIFVIVFLGSSQWHVYFLFKFVDRLMVLISTILYSVYIKENNSKHFFSFDKISPNSKLTPYLYSGLVKVLKKNKRHLFRRLPALTGKSDFSILLRLPYQ